MPNATQRDKIAHAVCRCGGEGVPRFDGASSNWTIECSYCDLLVSDRRYERAVGKWRDTWGGWRPAESARQVIVPAPSSQDLPADRATSS